MPFQLYYPDHRTGLLYLPKENIDSSQNVWNHICMFWLVMFSSLYLSNHNTVTPVVDAAGEDPGSNGMT